MTTYFTHSLIIGFIGFQLVVLAIVISNIIMLHRSPHSRLPADCPAVSILVPARNEEESITACVESLLAQEYPNFELIVLDDQSSDGTLRLLGQLRASRPALKVISGTPPPAGFTGKNWACTQLASHATGDLLLFTDADTVFQPHALSRIVAAQLAENADLVTGYPRQVLGSWGERLLVPFFLWAVMCFNPLWLAYRLQLRLLTSAVGQMLLFRRQAYLDIGGHAAVAGHIVEDLALAQRIKQAGLRWRVVQAHRSGFLPHVPEQPCRL